MFYTQFSTLSKYRVVQKDVSISLSLSFHIKLNTDFCLPDKSQLELQIISQIH